MLLNKLENNKNTIAYLFYLLSIALSIIYFFVSIQNSLVLWYDSAQGFLTYFNTIEGGKLNCWKEVDLNTGDNTYVFNSITTPGQYLFPAIFHQLGFNLGSSISITLFILCLLSIYGYRKLFLKFNFSELITAISIFLIISSRYINFHFNTYNGGVILTLTLFPFFILFFDWARDRNIFIKALITFTLVIAGFILKQSFLVFELCIIFYLCFNDLFDFFKNKSIAKIYSLLTWVISYGIGYFTINYFYLSKGWHANAMSDLSQYKVNGIVTILTCWMESLISAFSPGDIIRRIFYHPTNPLLPNNLNLISAIYVLLFLFSTIILFVSIKPTDKFFKRLFFSFLFGTTLIMGYFHLKGAALNELDERYFRNSSILFIPILLTYLSTFRLKLNLGNGFKFLLTTTVCFSVIYSLASYVVRTKQSSEYPLGKLGIRHNVTTKFLDKVIEIDNLYSSQWSVILIQNRNPSCHLEIVRQKNKFLHDGPSFEEMALRNQKFTLPNMNVFILMEKKYSTNNFINVAKMFPNTNIKQWKLEVIDSEYILISYIRNSQ